MSVPAIRYNAILTDNRIIPAQYVDEAGKTILIGLINPLWWVLDPVEQQGDEWGNQGDYINFGIDDNIDFNADNIVNVNVPVITLSEITIPGLDVTLPDFDLPDFDFDMPGLSNLVSTIKGAIGDVISSITSAIPGIGTLISSIVSIFSSFFGSRPVYPPFEERESFRQAADYYAERIHEYVKECVAYGYTVNRFNSLKQMQEML